MKKECLYRPGYVRAVLASYRDPPDTPSHCRTPDRSLAGQLFDRQIPLCTVRQTFLLASARRLLRPPTAPQLAPIRSLHYFLPVIEELLQNPLPDGYSQYLKRRLSARK